MKTISVEYSRYEPSDFDAMEHDRPVRWATFAATVRRVTRWLRWHEVHKDHVLKLFRMGFYLSMKHNDDYVSEAPRRFGEPYYTESDRYVQLAAAAAHQLTQLISMPDLRHGEYDMLFMRPHEYEMPWLKSDLQFAPLPSSTWPADPLVPPFIVRTQSSVFSPILIDGLTVNNDAWAPSPYRMTILENLVDIGGWHGIRPRLHLFSKSDAAAAAASG